MERESNVTVWQLGLFDGLDRDVMVMQRDEQEVFDNAIHVSAFEEVFHWFVKTCLKYNVQAFITTHSAEAIDAMLKVSHEIHTDSDPLKIITMRKSCKSNSTFLKIRTGEEAYQDREQYRMELRV